MGIFTMEDDFYAFFESVIEKLVSCFDSVSRILLTVKYRNLL